MTKIRAGGLQPRKPGMYGPSAWHRGNMVGTYADFEATDRADDGLKSAGGSEAVERVALPAADGSAPAGPADVLRVPRKNIWTDLLGQYQRRRVEEVRRQTADDDIKGATVAGAKNWRSLGPSVLLGGQALGKPGMGGRVAGLAVAPGGQLVYAATATGGVFRSKDAGASWHSLMDAFDVDPKNLASTSLCCGAIAMHPSNINRVYVGTGEGDTHYSFAWGRTQSNSPSYRGIGPIRGDKRANSDEFDWVMERTAAGSPNLAGEAFFQMAVDPRNGENVWAATTAGLYQRVIGADRQPEWVRRREGVFSAVVVVPHEAGVLIYAAQWGQAILVSETGTEWADLFAEYLPPEPDKRAEIFGRISLAVSQSDPTYAFGMFSNPQGELHGVGRLHVSPVQGDGPRQLACDDFDMIAGLPIGALGGQGSYNLSIAVDPVEPRFLYIGGGGFFDGIGAMIWRCEIVADEWNGLFAINLPIGRHAHADVHVLVHTPGNASELWAGSDGGVFLNRNPRSQQSLGTFEAKNAGLACLCPYFFDQHPTDRNILIAGLQDNGTAYANGNAKQTWTMVGHGDGGHCVFNWANPNLVARFQNGFILRSTNGGSTIEGFQSGAVNIGWAGDVGNSWIPPIVTTPYNAASPADGNILATATVMGAEAARKSAIVVSRDFGQTWKSQQQGADGNPAIRWREGIALPTSRPIFVMTFASANRIFAATADGQVFRTDYQPAQRTWAAAVRIDNAQAGALPIRGLISDIAIDLADAQRNAIYITFAGTGVGDHRRVWHFDGQKWQARSGSALAAADALLDVEHNAIAVDPRAPRNVYAAANIGVWHSADAGQTWRPLPNGLPDAAVFDLKFHPTLPLLRAALYGRGIYEWELDPIAVA